jgi:hypothetical protein
MDQEKKAMTNLSGQPQPALANPDVDRCRHFQHLLYSQPVKSQEYYVYCYIDPRNFEEFYYGKGTGSRSKAHLLDQGRSQKASRIKQIRAAGAEPIIRVVATGLTEEQAFWTEAALLWRLGKRLTNIHRGRGAAKFRPPDTLHTNLIGFDFASRIHFFNIGEYWGERSWDDCQKFDFLSAGHGRRYREAMQQLHKHDIVLAYISKVGYVGIGVVASEAVPARDFRLGRRRLRDLPLKAPGICHDSDNLDKCEYVSAIKWLLACDRQKALRLSGVFTPLQTRVSLPTNAKLLRYIERDWGVSFDDILEKYAT